MTACYQITYTIPGLSCEQLPYPAEHPQISRIRQRDKSDLPLPVLSYKYFLLQYSFSILSFYSPKSTSWQRHCLRTPRTLARTSSNNSRGLRFLLRSRRNGHQLHHPRGQFIIFFLPVLSLYSCSSMIPFTEYPLFFLLSLLSSKISRIWPIRS